jgi:type VI secretion system protein ImpG
LPSLRILQEYFLFPQKFLFFELDLSAWQDKSTGSEFRISLLCNPVSSTLPKVEPQQFKLFASPAVNLFKADAEPIVADHHRRESLIRMADMAEESYQIFSVDKVSGYSADFNRERDFTAYNQLGVQWTSSPVYSLIFKPAITEGKSDLLMSLSYPPEEPLIPNEILSVELTCCNANLPKALQLGDICEPTSSTPELVTFKNIEKPTAFVTVPLEGDLLSMLLSHLAVNQLSYSDHENLRTLLSLYIFPGGSDKDKDITNRRRVDAICGVEVTPEECLFEKRMVNGQRLKVLLNKDHFSNLGDIFLFGSILNSFFSSVVNINSYIKFEIEDAQYGERMHWPPKLGSSTLI